MSQDVAHPVVPASSPPVKPEYDRSGASIFRFDRCVFRFRDGQFFFSPADWTGRGPTSSWRRSEIARFFAERIDTRSELRPRGRLTLELSSGRRVELVRAAPVGKLMSLAQQLNEAHGLNEAHWGRAPPPPPPMPVEPVLAEKSKRVRTVQAPDGVKVEVAPKRVSVQEILDSMVSSLVVLMLLSAWGWLFASRVLELRPGVAVLVPMALAGGAAALLMRRPRTSELPSERERVELSAGAHGLQLIVFGVRGMRTKRWDREQLLDITVAAVSKQKDQYRCELRLHLREGKEPVGLLAWLDDQELGAVAAALRGGLGLPPRAAASRRWLDDGPVLLDAGTHLPYDPEPQSGFVIERTRGRLRVMIAAPRPQDLLPKSPSVLAAMITVLAAIVLIPRIVSGYWGYGSLMVVGIVVVVLPIWLLVKTRRRRRVEIDSEGTVTVKLRSLFGESSRSLDVEEISEVLIHRKRKTVRLRIGEDTVELGDLSSRDEAEALAETLSAALGFSAPAGELRE